MEPKPTQKKETTQAHKVTVFLLLFFYPLGIIVMWFWPKWKLRVKLALTALPILLGIIYFSVIAVFVDPTLDDKLRPLNNCISACSTSKENDLCARGCQEKFIQDNSFLR
ncbi:MAG: hypothetical protein ACD_22C00049G0003 [uncultured bacterium]|uniref:Uncharacterized protein n=1 Tax=candidate division WWE3 bacterium TaxID=2053526 RepID=A0A656PR12_UNCKA|nr:hypothetical protein P147_WWE3C00001G0348 [candidate division WWE3 bacterium RAAC2_WWE3_1]EKE00306.1 MAG: hypothetical protein ACD_22C00049G0003 [uncultured bacterium]KKS29696.1 MAG: hypothetical protein UU91_C0004G0088 [candidate division WWE3 bacterium GW2011_GWB1_42_117]KKS55506.1 MAG: hypothetical protein UV21_C0001G0088 [candidate division WWE3 bacterium GW2011_GWD2_42_34]KKT05991.1 MAG: hypothetical protein UV83_C0001G0309 [candidate division WWE3 bacterium GW2011_GWE2_43_18]KKT06909.